MNRRTLLAGLLAAGGGAGGLALALGEPPDGGETAEALVAGSLQALASRVPGATVEAHGSVAVRRLVVEGARDPDVVALADPRLFDGVSETATLFATNALVLTYRPDSEHADAIERDWRAALDEAAVGRTDPQRDPLGYRTVMAVQLDGELDDSVLDGTEVLPETSLLRTLEAGGLDAAFAYRNMAVEHDLPYVTLPDRVDFSNPSLADHYATATVEVGGETFRGGPIRYGVAALSDAGTGWADRLAGDAERLRDAGFTVPESYPAEWPR